MHKTHVSTILNLPRCASSKTMKFPVSVVLTCPPQQCFQFSIYWSEKVSKATVCTCRNKVTHRVSTNIKAAYSRGLVSGFRCVALAGSHRPFIRLNQPGRCLLDECVDNCKKYLNKYLVKINNESSQRRRRRHWVRQRQFLLFLQMRIPATIIIVHVV